MLSSYSALFLVLLTTSLLYLFVCSEYRMVKINIRDIEYIESMEDYIRIRLMGSKPVMTLMPIKKAVEKLPSGKFKHIHISYVGRINQVKAIGKRKVVLASGKKLPVGESYAGFIKEWMQPNDFSNFNT